nr:ribosomal protein 63, mitochondrial [Megalopta genalis]
MRITEILYKELIRVHNIPYRYRGKYRIEKKPTYKDILDYKKDLEREEQNMLLLRHPYLTFEQSCGHMAEKKKDIRLNKLNMWQETANARFNKRITIQDRLRHYMICEPWE